MQNELAILEFIHCLVETLDRYFSNVCELDLMFSLEQVSMHRSPSAGCYIGSASLLRPHTLSDRVQKTLTGI